MEPVVRSLFDRRCFVIAAQIRHRAPTTLLNDELGALDRRRNANTLERDIG
jgi:hypothetical protein